MNRLRHDRRGPLGAIVLVSCLWSALMAGAGAAAAGDRALLIGIDAYQDERIGLPRRGAAAADVEAIRGVLTSRLGYPADGIKVLTDAAATREGIVAAVADWLGGTGEGERAYLYFAGAGYFTEDKNGDESDGLDEAIVPVDARSSGREIEGLVTDDELTEVIASLAGRHVTVVLDTGHSGRVTRQKGETRAISVESRGRVFPRTPDLAEFTRSILVEPKVALQKAEGEGPGGGFVEKIPAGGTLAEWSAVSASQTALVDEAMNHGVFTSLYVEGLAGAGDGNGNGSISNAELYAYLVKGSEAYCKAHAESCEMGLVPQVLPASVLIEEAAKTGGAGAYGATDTQADSGPAPSYATVAHAGKSVLTIAAVMDLLPLASKDGVVVEQVPPSPVVLGTRDIRFEVTSPYEGDLVLLDLDDTGRLTQLYPNEFTRRHDAEFSGRIRAGYRIRVPDAYYGISFNATEPSSGTLIALILRDGATFGETVASRSIAVIPREEAVKVYLPALAEAVAGKAKTEAYENTGLARSVVGTIRYQIGY
ncbi:MAG: caspase family protein [Hyphomicrobiaceae bacterium]